MPSLIKIKFCPLTVDGKQGRIFYQVVHNRLTRRLKTSYILYAKEWDKSMSQVIFPLDDEDRSRYLQELDGNIQADVRCLYKIIALFDEHDSTYTVDDIVTAFMSGKYECNFFRFMENIIAELKKLGQIRTSETYTASLHSFRKFYSEYNLFLDELSSDVMVAYEAYLKRKGLSPNTSSFYIRNLRAVYNRAVEKGLTVQRYPFKHVYTGVEKTVKRAVPLKVIKQLKDMNLSYDTHLDFARDMFLFSFYTRGMSLVDMAYLRKSDLKDGVLCYRRRKTRQLLFVKWEKCMQEIVAKYKIEDSDYLLPIIKPHSQVDERKQYINTSGYINRSLKKIGVKLHISIPLTMYVSRHAWASIAKSKNIPLTVISEGLGHDSEKTTRIYLASLDTLTAIDKANKLILKLL